MLSTMHKTATNAGIMGANKLSTDIKFIWNYAGNCLTNQHGDINYTHDLWSTIRSASSSWYGIL